MRSPTTPLVLLTLLFAALPAGASAQQEDDQAFLRVPVPEEGEDRIHRVRTQVRHTTVIVLPADENILDFVVGDSEYWHLAGAANVAFLKPLRPDAATNIALVCESGRIYSFLVAEHSDGPPHLVVRFESGAEKTGLSGGGTGRPAFVARSEVAAYQQMAAEAAEAARSAREAAEAGILEAESRAASEIEAFRAGYPERLAFEYRLDGDAADRPFLVEAMWHDGQFTYLRSHAQESPALYELRDGEPALVAYDLSEDGLYIARHVLGDGWLQIGDKRASLAVHAAGSAPMSRWKQWVRPPEGALPGGIVTKAGVVLIAVLVGGLLFSWAMTGPQEADTLVALPEAQAVDDGMGRSLQARIRQEAERQTLEAAARARAELERRQAAAAEEMARLQTESETPNTAALIPGVSAAESELREALRLEELERRARSLRALPVAHTYRTPDAATRPSEPDGGAADADVPLLENAVQAALASFEQSVGALENELEAGLAGEQLLLGSPGIAAAAAPASGQQASRPAPSPIQPGRSVRPADPPGWERIYEGSFLEGVLLTQLSGDFPGPVLATVSVPFYSADRQRILIPRGARVVGTARAVQDPDQSRLAVAFHRLLLPDGSWIDLEFTGLNQAGEGALRDEVDRHYFSTFAAAGAIGVVSGLALAGGSPFGLRAGVGQGLGQSATSVLDRFLNRLPTITIRAGHRLRVWFTSDVLVPRAGTRQ